MRITIHKIEKYTDKWKVTFTSERNQQGMTIYTPAFDSVEKLVKHLEDYIKKNFPEEVITKPQEFDSDKIVIKEPESADGNPQTSEPSQEEKQLQEMQKELEDLQNQKDNLANQIKNLLEDWKLDLDLTKLKEEFDITNESYLQILEDKKQRKVAKYVELKTQYENLKQQISAKQEEIEQFKKENNLEEM